MDLVRDEIIEDVEGSVGEVFNLACFSELGGESAYVLGVELLLGD